METFLQGFILQAGLIMALGSQNIFVLETALGKRHHLLVAGVSSFCDVLMIFAGVGLSALWISQMPMLRQIMILAGAGFLLFYGLMKLYQSYRNQAAANLAKARRLTAKKAMILSLGFSLLNPHAYLDTFVFIGGYASRFQESWDMWSFAAGVSVFSVLWFFGLSTGASRASHLFASAHRQRWVARVSGILMVLCSYHLALMS